MTVLAFRAPSRKNRLSEEWAPLSSFDETGQRIDDLERSIGELTDAAGIDPDVGEKKA